MPRTTLANNKTVVHDGDVGAYLDSIENVGRREDAHLLLSMISEVTGELPRMWGPTMIGFGHYHFVYDSGREGDSFITGFAPRKANMVIYVVPGFADYTGLLGQLGKYRTGSCCLYLGRLTGVDQDILRKLITRSVADMRKRYGS